MAIDVRRIALTVGEAILNDLGGQGQEGESSGQRQQAQPSTPKKHGLSAGKALLIGAGVMTAGRAAMRARGGGLLDSLQERLASLEDGDRGDDAAQDVDHEAEEDFEDEGSEEPEDYEEEEPEDYEDEEPEDYEDDEPEDYEDEEPEDYEDEEPEDYEEEEPREHARERRRSRVSSGAATKRRRRGSRDGHGDDGAE
jgi:hypothetical protein